MRLVARQSAFRFLPMLLMGILGGMLPQAALAQEMMGRPVMGKETVATGPDGRIYVVASPAQHQQWMGPAFGRTVLFALDPTTFRVLWRYVLEDEDLVASRPVVGADGTVYLTMSETMEFGPPLDSQMALRNARLLAVRGGTLKWAYEFDAPFASDPVLSSEGLIFVTTSAVGPVGMPGPWMFARSSFLALEDRETSPVVRARLDLGSLAVSAPVVHSRPMRSWVVYVTGEGTGRGPGMGMGQGTVLFIIGPDFSVTRVSLR